MRRKRGREGPRRPRARLVTLHSGGLGSPSAPTTGSCLEWLHGWRRRRRKLPDRGSEELSCRAHGSTVPGTEKPPMERRVATRLRTVRPPQGGRLMVAPLGAPFPRAWPEGRRKCSENGARVTAYPAPQRIRAMTRASLSFRDARSVGPESIIQSRGYGFRARSFHSRPGMTKRAWLFEN